MIDHIGIAVSDLGQSRKFYEAALKPLGIAVRSEVGGDKIESGFTAIGFGREGDEGFFWIAEGERVGEGTHVALSVDSREAVDAFHKAALEAGGKDHGAPGLRPHYGPNYYAAFVYGPDGVNFEVVCNKPG